MEKTVVNNNTTNDRIVRQAEVAVILGISSVTLWRWRQKVNFLSQSNLGQVVWSVGDCPVFNNG